MEEHEFTHKVSYIDFDRLKRIIELTDLVTNVETSSKHFSEVFQQEIERVDSCYVFYLEDMEYLLGDLKRMAVDFVEHKEDQKWKENMKESALKRSAASLHNKITKLEAYRQLNRTAAIKILRKHDVMAMRRHEECLMESHIAMVGRAAFGDPTKLLTIKTDMEVLYAHVFCHGVLEEAQDRLRLAKTHTDPQVMLGVSFKVGIILTLLAWLAYNFAVAPQLSLLYLSQPDPTVVVYAVVGALITYRWFWGFSVYMWDSVDIDYMLILDFDETAEMPSSDIIFSSACNWTIYYLMNVIFFHLLRFEYQHQRGNSAGGFVELMSQHAYFMPIGLLVGTVLIIAWSMRSPISCGVFSYDTVMTVSECAVNCLSAIRICSFFTIVFSPF